MPKRQGLFLLITSCVLIGICGSSSAKAAVLKSHSEGFIPYENEFASVIVMIPKTHQTLFSFKPDHSRVAASLTKLANALAFVRLQPNWNRVVSLKKSDEVGGGRLRVNAGAQLTVRDLFFSSITASANNAATALQRISALGSKGFIQRMNREARLAGATHSTFKDASGMNAKNMTTARDMALIAERAFRDPMIGRAASTSIYDFSLIRPQQRKIIHNTNALLTDEQNGLWVTGGKTGYLPESNYNFVVQLRPIGQDGRPDARKELIIVVMGSPTKEGSFRTAKRLAEWAWKSHEF